MSYIEVNLDNVEVEDVNEKALEHLKNAPKEVLPEGVVFNGKDCVDCEDPIDAVRLNSIQKGLIHSYRCADCKPYYDKEQRAKTLRGCTDTNLYLDD